MVARIRHKRCRTMAALLVGICLSWQTGDGFAKTVILSPGADNLRQALVRAAPGDILRLQKGIYKGPVTITKSLQLVGQPGAAIRGSGEGSTITVSAPDVVVRGLTISGSGRAIKTMDSGIFVDKSGDRALIEQNRFENNLFGVYFWGPDDAVMRNNIVTGLTTLHVNSRGNGVSLWNSPGSVIDGNDFRFGRDGIFTTTSRRNIFRRNRFRDVRIAIHYMYTNDSVVSDNISLGNHVGFALMFSRNLTVKRNISIGDRDHGILLNYANDSVFDGNRVSNGKTKCVFIYNSNKNEFIRNVFEGCAIGVHFTAGSERNTITSNAFINNRTQVKYVGSRNLDWSVNGRGNFWSDNPAFDLNGDGISDATYRPNDLVDRVVWAHPTAKLLLNSPAIQMLRWAQSRFPSLLPGGVVDSAPLMTPLHLPPVTHWQGPS